MIKFAWHLIVGEQAADPTDTQQNISTTSLFPLLTVIGLEGSKCILILYDHSNQIGRGFWRRVFSLRGLLRLFLIGISCFCSLIFFAQLMNKPNEDEINSKIETARIEVYKGIDTKIENSKNADTPLKDLRERRGKLEQENIANRLDLNQEIKVGGNGRIRGRGPVAKGIEEIIKSTNEEVEKLDDQIKAREKELEDKVRAEVQNNMDRRKKSITKEGRALDPKWMSAILSSLHEAFHPETQGNYTRRWAVIFLGAFSLMISFALELIINEMFKRVAKEISATYNNSKENNYV